MSSGFYTAKEAARIARVPLTTLSYWARTGLLEPSQRATRPRLYSFEDLRDLRVAQTLREQGARGADIRAVLDFLRRPDNAERLAHAELEVVGGRVVYRSRPRQIDPIEPSRHGQRVFAVEMRQIFADLGSPEASVDVLRPAPHVIIDPEVRGGTPVVAGTRVPTALIAELRADGLAVEDVLRSYPSLTPDGVAAAVEWEARTARGA